MLTLDQDAAPLDARAAPSVLGGRGFTVTVNGEPSKDPARPDRTSSSRGRGRPETP